MGWPGTGRPGAGRMVPAGAPVCAVGATGLGGGALYTGRGPVCGTIMRGAGGCGGPATTGGAAGRGGALTGGGACGAVDAEIDGDAGATTAGGGTGGAGRTGAAAGGATTTGGAIGLSTTGGGATVRIGAAGTTGDCGGGGGVAGAAGFATGGAITGLAITGGATGLTGTGVGAAASFFCVIARSTSPGREIFDKSILVLISSSPRSGREDLAEDVCDSAEPRRWTRTFSASKSSSELECVFFSVTPTSGNVSRIALLLTSIRTLLIRPFVSALGLHCDLTE